MKDNQLLKMYEKQLRQETVTKGFHREEADHVVRHISLFGEKGFIIYSDLNEDNAVEIIKREKAYFRQKEQAFEWKVYSYDHPSNLKDLLLEEGFTIDPAEALMIIDLKENHHLLIDYDVDGVQEVVDERGINDIVTLENKVWNTSHDELGARLWRDKQRNPNELYLYGIYQDNCMVSAAWMYLEENSSFASLWGGSTLSHYRGLGFYKKLLAIRAQKALELGYPYLTVDASPMSRPILERLGFNCLAYTYGCQSPSNL